MTDAQIAVEYLRREASANATPRGADCQAIAVDVAAWADADVSRVNAIILDTVMAGAG